MDRINWTIEDPELEGVGKESSGWIIIANDKDYSDICTIVVGKSSDPDEEQKKSSD